MAKTSKIKVCVRVIDNQDFIFHPVQAKRADMRVEEWEMLDGKPIKKVVIGGIEKEVKADTTELEAALAASYAEVQALKNKLSKKVSDVAEEAAAVREPSGSGWDYGFDPDWTKKELVEYAESKFSTQLAGPTKGAMVDELKAIEDALRP